MLWLTKQERVTLTALGTLVLAALCILIWQRQRPPLAITGKPIPAEAVYWNAALAAARQVDLNTAGVAELERLPGIGYELAGRIVEFRSTHGGFTSAEDLTKVRGIGPKTIETLRDYIAVR